MKYVIDGRVEDGKAISLINNRAFQFGDGVFETILVNNEIIRFSRDHYSRLTKALSSIRLNSELLNFDAFEHNIRLALESNGLQSARVKYMVYRKPSDAPGYKTNTCEFSSCIIAKPLQAPEVIIHNKTSQCTSVYLHNSPYSAYKTMSSLPYVLAEIEKSDKKLDELILLDNHHNVSECCSSNIFWITNNEISTPPLSTGCLAGIMRKQIIDSQKVNEVSITYNELTKADVVFCTNIARLGIFASIDGHQMATTHHVLDKIKPLWAL